MNNEIFTALLMLIIFMLLYWLLDDVITLIFGGITNILIGVFIYDIVTINNESLSIIIRMMFGLLAIFYFGKSAWVVKENNRDE